MIGTLLNDRYRIDAQLGQGGMGVVYRAHDTLLDRDVAIKVLSKTGLGSQGRARLLHEAQAAAQLHHPNVVSVYDAGQADGAPFIVMELVEGQALDQQMPKEIGQVLAIARQVCAALDHAHTRSIVHRDLKPENVVIAADGTVKLTDFGLARSLSSRMTTEGKIVGTVFYLAPEVALGQPVDGRTDLYSFGVMLYEMLAGQLPFSADEPLGVISQHLYSSVVPPSTYNPGIPAALDALVVRLMNKLPQDRPPSAAAVAQELEVIGSTAAAVPAESPTLLDRLARGRMVGREKELAEAAAHWRQAAAGDGHVLLISGEPGIGKTRMAHELTTVANVYRATILTCECYAEGGPPYAPIAQAIRQALAASESPLDLPETVLADLVALAPELQPAYPHLAPNPALGPEAEQQRLFESFVRLCNALAARSPLLLLVDDAHWADGSSLALLRYLARRTRGTPVLIVLTYREVELDQSRALNEMLHDLNRERLAARIKLARLGLDQTRAMLAAMLSPSGEIGPQLVEAIHAETEGNPFFVEEVCKALVEEGKLRYEGGKWTAAALEEMEIPQSVRVTIQGRLGRLPAPVQDVLLLASVIGREFDFESVRRAGEIDEDSLIEALESAEQAQIIDEEPGGRGASPSFTFAHVLIRTTLYESLSSPRRMRLHRRVAAAIEALRPNDLEALAHHHEQAGNPARAQDYYMRAGDRALDIYAYQEAEQHFRAALELNETTPERADLLARLGEALFCQNRYQQAIETWGPAIELYQSMNDADRVALYYARSARAAWHDGEHAKGLELCREGLAATEGCCESPGMATLLHETGRACVFNGQPEEALPLCQQALEMARKLQLISIQAEALATIGVVSGQPEETVRQSLQQAIDLAEPANLLTPAIRAHVNLGALLVRQGDYPAGRLEVARAVELAHRAGNPGWEHDYLLGGADYALAVADFAAVEEALARMRSLHSSMPNIENKAFAALCMEGYLRRAQGRWEEAEQILRKCQEEELRLHNGSGYRVVIDGSLGEMFFELGRMVEAEMLLLEAITLQKDPAYGVNWVWPTTALASLYSRLGRLEEARQAFEQAASWTGDFVFDLDQATLRCAEGELAAAEKHWPEALAAFESAIEITDRIGARLHLGRAKRDMARVYLARGESGDKERAQGLLEEALATFREIQAPGYVEMTDKMLGEPEK